MKLGEAELSLKLALESIYEPSEAAIIARLAIEDITALDQSSLPTSREKELNSGEQAQYNDMKLRLMAHEPIQYVTGKSWFYGLQLYVAPSVLIPRPETEELVDWIVKTVKATGLDVFEKKPMKADETSMLKILDVGTGSGCIALALKSVMPRAEVWGCDTSEEALNIARRNGSMLDIRVDFQGVDFLDEAQRKLLPTVDIIVSNPPYIPVADKHTMHNNVLQYEPHLALFVPDQDPLLFYKALAAFAMHRLYSNGLLFMETHEQYARQVLELFQQKEFEVELKKDMQGKDRMIRAKKILAANEQVL